MSARGRRGSVRPRTGYPVGRKAGRGWMENATNDGTSSERVDSAILSRAEALTIAASVRHPLPPRRRRHDFRVRARLPAGLQPGCRAGWRHELPVRPRRPAPRKLGPRRRRPQPWWADSQWASRRRRTSSVPGARRKLGLDPGRNECHQTEQTLDVRQAAGSFCYGTAHAAPRNLLEQRSCMAAKPQNELVQAARGQRLRSGGGGGDESYLINFLSF